MTTDPSLFDRSALCRHRTRAQLDDPFLHHATIDEVQDRLSLVNRTFNSIAIVTPFSDLWRPHFPDAHYSDDTDTLDLPTNHFDLVIHAMCLHWANDPVGQLIQCRRALIKDGLCLAISLGGQTLSELRTVLAQAESAVSGGLSPRVSPMAELREMGALLQRAGLALPVADTVSMTGQYRDMSHLMHDLRAMGETNAMSARSRHPTPKTVFQIAADLYQTQYPIGQDHIRATFDLVCLTGWAPADTQPEPLRPGSATARLADALKTTESKLPD